MVPARLDGADVALDRAEPVVVPLPLLAVGDDLVVAAAHEVPPHHQLLGERGAAEQKQPRRAVPAIGQMQPVVAGALIGEIGDRQHGPAGLDIALIDEHPVLEGLVHIEGDVHPGFEIELRTQQRGERVHRGSVALELTEEHPDGDAARRSGRGCVVREVAAGAAGRVGQGHPQLRSVQHRGVRRRHLRVADSRARSHQVQFTGAHQGMHACAVTMFHLAAEQPADGLQPGVRMWGNVHPRAAADVVGPVVVGEAPRTDQRTLPLGQRPSHPDGARAAERHFSRM